jgi:hypothetical protein
LTASVRNALACLVLTVSVGTVQAGSDYPHGSVILQQIASKLEAENVQCFVEVAYTGRLATQRMEMPSRFDSALLVVYTTEGCGGGINWSASAQVYGLKDETFRELGGPQTWSVVQGADFSHTRAPIRTVNQAPGDGHCCPTDGRTVEVTMLGDQPVFREVETWKAGN